MTTIAAAPPSLTPDDLLRLPNGSSAELVHGRLLEKDVSILSSDTEGQILELLRGYAAQHGSAKVLPASLGYRCFPNDPNRVRRPDCTVIRADRFAGLRDPNAGYMPIVPDLAIEVVSTNDTLFEIDEKVEEYLDAGFPLVWVADPFFPQLFIYSASEHPRLLTGDDEVRCESVLPGFVCKLSELFPPRP